MISFQRALALSTAGCTRRGKTIPGAADGCRARDALLGAGHGGAEQEEAGALPTGDLAAGVPPQTEKSVKFAGPFPAKNPDF